MLSKQHYVGVLPVPTSPFFCSNSITCHSVNFGRVPTRTVFEDSLQCLTANQEKMQSYISHEFPIDDVAKGPEVFEERKARKVILNISD